MNQAEYLKMSFEVHSRQLNLTSALNIAKEISFKIESTEQCHENLDVAE